MDNVDETSLTLNLLCSDNHGGLFLSHIHVTASAVVSYIWTYDCIHMLWKENSLPIGIKLCWFMESRSGKNTLNCLCLLFATPFFSANFFFFFFYRFLKHSSQDRFRKNCYVPPKISSLWTEFDHNISLILFFNNFPYLSREHPKKFKDSF